MDNLIRRFRAFTLPIILAAHPAGSAESRTPSYANDIGPAEIDVSSYPAEYQTTYQKLFLKDCGVCHSTARAVNSEFLEIPPADIPALAQAGLLEDPQVLRAEKDIWARYVKQMKMRPPCCGVCPYISQEEAKEIWKFLVYDSRVRKTGARALGWQAQRRALLAEFARRHPKAYGARYGNLTPGGKL